MSPLLKETFVDNYLKRLQYSGPVLPNLQTLKTLHRLHLLHIPFENLKNLLQEDYCTTKEDLYKTIVQGHRGGVCYELNGLFAFLLQDLGFSLIMVEAIVYDHDRWSPSSNHQISIVSLGEEKWVVGVGFGECFAVPLRLVESEIQDDGTANYRIRKDVDETGHEMFIVESTSRNAAVLHVQNEAEKSEVVGWQNVYKFSHTPRTIEHFANTRNQILKESSSPLNQGFLCTMLRPWGRITISRYKLIKKYVNDKKITAKEVKMLENQ